MNKEEKILMIRLLLEDIRGNWGWENNDRAGKAYELSKELYEETKDENWKEMCSAISLYDGDDGRYFRDDFPYGYIGMRSLYNITNNLKDKSDEFKKIFEDYITYPENRLDDVE